MGEERIMSSRPGLGIRRPKCCTDEEWDILVFRHAVAMSESTDSATRELFAVRYLEMHKELDR